MNAVEPSDMFEYISRHFKAYNFDNMQSIQAKSLYISHVVSNFHGTEIEILAGFWLVGKTEKNIWADYEQLFKGIVFMFSWPKKNFKKFQKYCSVLVWVQSSVLIQRYGVNADESRWDPGRDNALRLEDGEHGGVR